MLFSLGIHFILEGILPSYVRLKSRRYLFIHIVIAIDVMFCQFSLVILTIFVVIMLEKMIWLDWCSVLFGCVPCLIRHKDNKYRVAKVNQTKIALHSFFFLLFPPINKIAFYS